MEPKATPKKGVQSKLRDESLEWIGSSKEYPIDSTPLAQCQTSGQTQRQAVARAAIQSGSLLILARRLTCLVLSKLDLQ